MSGVICFTTCSNKSRTLFWHRDGRKLSVVYLRNAICYSELSRHTRQSRYDTHTYAANYHCIYARAGMIHTRTHALMYCIHQSRYDTHTYAANYHCIYARAGMIHTRTHVLMYCIHQSRYDTHIYTHVCVVCLMHTCFCIRAYICDHTHASIVFVDFLLYFLLTIMYMSHWCISYWPLYTATCKIIANLTAR